MSKRKNKDLEIQIDDEIEEVDVELGDEDVDAQLELDNVFTYIGGGEDSPQVINFMGRQKFVRGRSVTVTDPIVLSKIKNNPTFVAGSVDSDELFEMDEAAQQRALKIREEDKKIDANFKKKYNKE